MEEIAKYILTNNTLSVFSYFILGVLVLVFYQNVIYYIKYKNKMYLLYFLYAFFAISDQILIHYNSYHESKFGNKIPIINVYSRTLQWIYNCTYAYFVIVFAGFPKIRPKYTKFFIYLLYFLFSVLFVSLITEFFYKKHLLLSAFTLVLSPLLMCNSLFTFYYLFRLKSRIKYYILPGSLAYTVFSILSFFLPAATKNQHLSWNLFYTGVFIEAIFFSLGLIEIQKIIFKEKKDTQKKLILQLLENEKLKTALAKKLTDEIQTKTEKILTLHKKSEIDKIKTVENVFKKELAQIKILALQNQMNPHFIFNSLNSIKLFIIKNDKEKAVYYLNKFSKLIRKILATSREKVVSLENELETISLYVNIENMRFKNELNFNIITEKSINTQTIKIPPLILQPFIENAIWHGLSAKKGKKIITINITKLNKNYIQIAIIDNGIGRKNSEKIKQKKHLKKKSYGLQLTKERLNNFSKNYKNSYHLSFLDLIENNQAIGTKICLDLPIK